MKTTVNGKEFDVTLEMQENEKTLWYQINVGSEDVCDGQSFPIDDIENAWSYLQDSFSWVHELNISKKLAKELMKELLQQTKANEVYYQIEATEHQGYQEHYGLYRDLHEVFEDLLEWDLPDNYVIDIFSSKKELDEFLEECDLADLKFPEYKYPITICSDHGFSNYVTVKGYDLHRRDVHKPLPDSIKEYLVDAHFHDYQRADLYKITNHKKELIDWLQKE